MAEFLLHFDSDKPYRKREICLLLSGAAKVNASKFSRFQIYFRLLIFRVETIKS